MARFLIFPIFLLACFSIAPPAVADDAPSTIEYIESLPKPKLMDGIGNSHLAISTDSERAQRYFDQGVSLLHDFWWFEAYRSFRRVAELDAKAPMAHWGLYLAARGMANLSDAERESQLQQAIDSMKELAGNASEREKYYLDSVIMRHETDGQDGADAYRAELEALLVAYPDEVEARLLLWLALDGGFDAEGRPQDDQVYSQLLLERELEKHPDNQGLMHYWIHTQEAGKHPEDALPAAERLADLAPNAGHIVHMPGHIHFVMGNYGAAHEQFRRAEETDLRYMDRYGIDPVFTWNYLHNISFLIANLAEAGRIAEASDYASAFAASAEASEFKNFEGYGMLAARAVIEPFRLALRTGYFSRAAEALRAAPNYAGPEAERFNLQREAYQAYADGMAAAQSGDAEAAARAADRLDATLWQANRDEQRLYGQQVLNILSLELRGLVEHVAGDTEAGIELLQRAIRSEADLRYREPPPNVRPVAETLAQIYLETERWDEAREAYRQVLQKRKNSGYGLFGIARSYELEGDRGKAVAAYREFLDGWADADEGLWRRQHAIEWLAANE